MKYLRTIFDERTVLAFAGLGLMAAGLWFVFAPLAAIVPGAALFGVSVLPLLRRG